MVETGTAVRPRLPPGATVPVTSLPGRGSVAGGVLESRGTGVRGSVVFRAAVAADGVHCPLVYGSTGTEFYARVTTPEGVVVETPRIPVAYASTGHVSVVGIPQTGETLTISSTARLERTRQETRKVARSRLPTSAPSAVWWRQRAWGQPRRCRHRSNAVGRRCKFQAFLSGCAGRT